MIEPSNAAIALGIQMTVGHPPPYTAEECGSVERLLVHMGTDLAEARLCPNLRALDVFASEVDLSVLPELPNLRELRLSCSRITGGLAPLTSCPGLEILEVLYCDVTDITAIVGHPGIRRGILKALPLDPGSRDLLPRMARAKVPGSDRATVWLRDSDEEHAVTMMLWERGVELVYGIFDGHTPMLVRPGVASSRRLGVDYAQANEATIRRIAESDLDTTAMLKAVVAETRGSGPRRAFNFRSARQIGDADDALDWIEGSRAGDDVKAALAGIVGRFPDLVFFQESPGLSGMEEKRHRIRLPSWYVNYRVTVAGVAPHILERRVAWRLDGTDYPLPAVNSAGELWMSLGMHGTWHPDHQPVLDAGWFCVGVRLDGRPAALVVRLGADDDHRVYAYDPAAVNRGALSEPPVPVYDDWASLLRRVTAVRLDGDVVEALE